METLKMSRKEINQISVFKDLEAKTMKQTEAAKLLDLSVRHIGRKLKAFRLLGPTSLIHKSRGRPSNNKLNFEVEQKALELVREKYSDFGPTFASEKLLELDNLKIHPETLRLKMTDIGLWKVRKRKSQHREWRERKECFGELTQLDGSNHLWFEARAPRCDLLAFIDDATNTVTHLEFAPETTLGVMKATKKYIEKHGLPYELYVDRGKVFKVNLNNPDNERLTQYGRAMDELGVGIIYARSPQAKGRVERLFGVLQDRLVKELRLRSISTIEEANKYIENEFLEKFNQKFSVPAKSETNLHRSFKGYSLDGILAQKDERILTSDFTIRYENQWFQLEKKQKTILFPKDKITVVTRLDGMLRLVVRDTELLFHKTDKPVKRKCAVNIQGKKRQPWIPPANHPWRKFNIKSKPKQDISTLEKEDISTLV